MLRTIQRITMTTTTTTKRISSLVFNLQSSEFRATQAFYTVSKRLRRGNKSTRRRCKNKRSNCVYKYRLLRGGELARIRTKLILLYAQRRAWYVFTRKEPRFTWRAEINNHICSDVTTYIYIYSIIHGAACAQYVYRIKNKNSFTVAVGNRFGKMTRFLPTMSIIINKVVL